MTNVIKFPKKRNELAVNALQIFGAPMTEENIANMDEFIEVIATTSYQRCIDLINSRLGGSIVVTLERNDIEEE